VSFEPLAEVVLDPGLPPAVVYAVLLASCVVESFFPPWPADVITLYTGFLAGRGVLAPWTVLGVAVAGTQTGVMTAFWVSRRWGRALFEGPMARYLPISRLGRLESWFARYGAPAIAISRFFPGIRALVTPAAGLAGFAAWKVWVFAGISVVLWNIFVVGIGLVAGREIEWAKRILVRYNAAALLLLAALLVATGLVLLMRRHRRS
jgi:membrane protein DedA with SNARE-associated domain